LNSVNGLFLYFLNVVTVYKLLGVREVKSLALDMKFIAKLIKLIDLNFYKVYILKILTNALKEIVDVLSEDFGLYDVHFSRKSGFKLEGLLRVQSFPVQ
jgi:hypothetical protein